MKTRSLLFALIAAVPLLFSCQSRLDPIDHTSDAAERESVWQYLKAFSIYQDSSIYIGKIPGSSSAYNSPQELLRAVNDTLKWNPAFPYWYTDYDRDDPSQYMDTAYDWQNAWLARAVGAEGGAASADDIVRIDTLTDSTIMLSIYTFMGWESDQIYNDFLKFVPILNKFPNIIVDLRDNTGGYIDEAQNIISAMVPAGTDYVLARQRDYDTVHGGFVTRNWHPWTTTGPKLLTGKHRYAVLSNGWTASASELCLNGLYEGQKKEWGPNYSMPLLGSTSYGKGIGQVIISRRKASSPTYPSFDTLYSGDTAVIVPISVTEHLLLKITFLQLKGLSERIGKNGVYHDIGIPADTVSYAIRHLVDNTIRKYAVIDSIYRIDSLNWTAPLCGLKILEPSANIDSVVKAAVDASAAKRVAKTVANSSLHKSIGSVYEKKITVDKIFPYKH